MGHTGKERRGDDRQRHRKHTEEEPPTAPRVFLLTDAQRERIARYLRQIDEAKLAVEAQHDAANRRIIRELKAAADGIFELISNLDEAD